MNIIYVFFLLTQFSVVYPDYYELLGISRDADNREIRKAFKTLALKLHPDKNVEKESSHENFVEINKAYEVLKDPDTRKKYDLYGEEGLVEDFGKSWKGQYQSWNYYYETFGIYDDDEEIITLNRNDFEQSVYESSDLWFINYYSPHCSHCHTLAPVWRRLALNFDGVLRFGAVNCDDDFFLCRQQHINSYPSLIMYPQSNKYNGPKDYESLKDYVFSILPYNIVKLKSVDFKETLASSSISWLIFTCKDSDDCITSEDLKKLGVILDDLMFLAEIDSETDKEICSIIQCNSPILLYLKVDSIDTTQHEIILLSEHEVPQLLEKVLSLLPDFEELNKEAFQEMRKNLLKSATLPMFIQFFKKEVGHPVTDIDLKRVKAVFPSVNFGYFNCQLHSTTCSSLYIQKFPTFILFKPGGSYEIHNGKTTAFDITKFIREAISSQVRTLTPEDFPTVLESGETWFIDFFAPWCAPCMQFLPHWRKASQSSDHSVLFASVDCTIHISLCRQYNIRSYPTAILYNHSVPHKYHGSHSSEELEEFIEDILIPPVVSLSPASFKKIVDSRKNGEFWAIDFFAPWCNPCQQLAPEWRKMAKLFKEVASVKIGEMDCVKHSQFCSAIGINSYPTIRLYLSENETGRFVFYNGMRRDASTLRAWIQNYLPSKVTSLTSSTFKDILSDSKPWLVDFFTPWCGHCHSFAPQFEKIAEAVEGKVKTGKINCDEFPSVCQLAHVNAYPTVIFYKGKKENEPQSVQGVEINILTFNGVMEFLEDNININFQSHNNHDEL